MALIKDMSEAVTNNFYFNTKGIHVLILLTFFKTLTQAAQRFPRNYTLYKEIGSKLDIVVKRSRSYKQSG